MLYSFLEVELEYSECDHHILHEIWMKGHLLQYFTSASINAVNVDVITALSRVMEDKGLNGV